MNMLSVSFGMIFEDDFLYNMTHNAGTFRDIILTDFADTPLTKDLQQVVFFAAHSISTRGAPVIKTDADTLSSLTEKRGGLVVAALASKDRVLGLSDWTFMTGPYSSMPGNDQLISNIAEFLVSGQRDYTLVDFPYFFGDVVDLSYTGEEAVGGEVLSQAGLLQSAFDIIGKKLQPRKVDSVRNDVLFIGLYDGLDYVQDYLTTRDISVTVESGVENGNEMGDAPDEKIDLAEPDVLTDTMVTEPELELPVVETPEPAIKGKISVANLGEFPTDSVTLLSLGKEAGYNVMIVLAASESALAQALEILSLGDLSQCLTGDRSALCPSIPVTMDLLEPLEDFYLPLPDSEIPMTSSLEFIEPIEPPLLP